MVKQRMTALDVRASIEEMRQKLVGLRLTNLYDLNPKMFLMRFGHGDNKQAVLLEKGVRLHLTAYTREKPQVPSQFTLKLRKHIRSWRLDSIVQLQHDRTIDFCFGARGTESCFHIIVELFSKGNIILTDHAYTILMLLRTHKDDDVKIAVHQTYPVTEAVDAASNNEVVLHEWTTDKESGALEMAATSSRYAEETVKKEVEHRTEVLKQEWLMVYHRNGGDETLKSTLSGVRHFGPAVAEHVLARSKVSPYIKKKDNTKAPEELFELLLPELLTAWDFSRVQLPTGGYLIASTKPSRRKNAAAENVVEDAQTNSQQSSEEVQYTDFSPLILAQYDDASVTTLTKHMNSFGDVCDAFFLPTEADKIDLHNEKKKTTVLSKREKFERDHQRRISALERQQELNVTLGQTLLANADCVDEAIHLINGALATGIQWTALKELVKMRHDEGHPVAYIIHKLLLEKNAITVLLEQELYDDENDEDVAPLEVEVSLSKSAHANATDYFTKKKANQVKLEKTLASTEKAAAGAARKGERQAAKKSTLKQLVVERKRGWWEKYNWFRTSTGDIALQGKDHQTSEILVRRVMRPGDLVVHCDLPGSLVCILRPMTGGGAQPPAGVSYQSIHEVGGWCISRSESWQKKQSTSAWWVYASQITGGSSSGSYLFAGERRFIPPQVLSLGFGLLFAVDRNISETSLRGDGEGDVDPATVEFPGLLNSIRDENGHTSIPVDPAASLHKLLTVEELRAQQRRNVSSITEQQQQRRAAATHTDCAAGAEKKRQILQGNLTKQQSRKLQKIRKKYGDQDEEDRQHGILLNGNAAAVVQELVSAPSSVPHTSANSALDSGYDVAEVPPSAPAPPREEPAKMDAKPPTQPNKAEVSADELHDELQAALPFYTSHPLPTDHIHHVVGFCAPFSVLYPYPFRIELQVGTAKKGQVAERIKSYFSEQTTKLGSAANLTASIKELSSVEIVEQLRSDVKPRV